MTTLREAAQQALEALDYCIEHSAEIVAERAKDRGQGSDDLQMMMVEYLEKHRCVITALRAALAEQKCPCGDRPADQCPGEWEPGCDLGANEKYAKVAEQPQPLTIERLRDALVASRIIDPGAVEDPDDYDDGLTLHRIEALYRRLG